MQSATATVKNGDNWAILNPWAKVEWITMDELEARFPKDLDKNPLLRGELGRYEGIVIHYSS